MIQLADSLYFVIRLPNYYYEKKINAFKNKVHN